MSAAKPTVHNPTNFEPADYEVLDYHDNKRPEYCGGPVEAYRQDIEDWQAEMTRAFGPEWTRKVHRCIHCGNTNIRYITAVHHRQTDEVVVFGSDCTERLGFANRQAWKLAQIKSRAELRHARLKVYRMREEFLAATPELVEAIEQAKDSDNPFVRDVLSKLDRYGSLSVAQVEHVIKALARDRERAARIAAEANEPKGDAPTGRVEVTGRVLSVQVRENGFGLVTKMLLKLENNSKVWVTAPAGVEAGSTITVRATFEQSRDDRSFGFGKRPHLVKGAS